MMKALKELLFVGFLSMNRTSPKPYLSLKVISFFSSLDRNASFLIISLSDEYISVPLQWGPNIFFTFLIFSVLKKYLLPATLMVLNFKLFKFSVMVVKSKNYEVKAIFHTKSNFTSSNQFLD